MMNELDFYMEIYKAMYPFGKWIFNKYTINELRNENNTTPGGFIKIQPKRQKL